MISFAAMLNRFVVLAMLSGALSFAQDFRSTLQGSISDPYPGCRGRRYH